MVVYTALRLNDAADWPQLGPDFRQPVVVLPSAAVDADSVEDTLPTGTTGGQFSLLVQSDGIESQRGSKPIAALYHRHFDPD